MGNPVKVVIDETIQYTKSRMAFGKPLLDNQYMHFRLAELQTELDLVRRFFQHFISLFLSSTFWTGTNGSKFFEECVTFVI